MKKRYGVEVYRRDLTVPPTEQEKKISEKTGKEFRYPKKFIVWVNSAVPLSHKMLRK